MPILESRLEELVGDWCALNDVIYTKIKFSSTGYPDRLLIFPTGQHVWWEAKREHEKPRKLQQYRINELSRRGAIAFWTDNYDDTILVLQAVLDAPFVSEESDTAFALASIRRAILRSWTWKDEYLPRSVQDFEGEGAR